jgi:hypothetical protein
MRVLLTRKQWIIYAAVVAIAIVLGLIIACPSSAADCPDECKPKTPTCEERIARAKRAGCEMPTTVKIVDHRVEVPVPGPERVVTQTVEVPVPTPGPERVVKVTEYVPAPAAGHWIVGAGPVWRERWGATAVVGYQFPSGWQLQGGPVYLPQAIRSGMVTYRDCPDGGGGPGDYNPCCVSGVVPYHTRRGSAWGAQALALYRF